MLGGEKGRGNFEELKVVQDGQGLSQVFNYKELFSQAGSLVSIQSIVKIAKMF